MKFKQGIALLPLIILMLALFVEPHSQAAQRKTGKQAAKSKAANTKTSQKQAAKKPEPGHQHTEHAAAEHKAGEAEANRITVEELKASIEKNEPVIILDVRSEGSYESSDKKIKGAVRMLTDEIEARLKEIPRDRLVVTYCT